MGIIVYHYTLLDVLKKIVESKRVRFTKINSLNDTSEYKYGIQLLKNRITEFENNNNIENKFDQDLFDRFSFCDKLYSTSFTENGDDLAFWNSYYVDKSTPISIGIMNDEAFSKNDFIINRCIYDNPYPAMSKERYQWFREIFDLGNILQLSKNLEYLQITFQTAHIKHKAFQIEKEWRAVTFGSKDSVIRKFNRNGKEIEYFDQDFNVESIREIIVGPSKHQEINYEEISVLISSSLLNCSVRKSSIPLEL